ncbi:unnamed protein product [Rotaria sp. Silwood1]|nr:unnamed protein product [Rotaria sp. Silwood1]CAF1596497.1 unnamed protein product [Rotaria sp. Silwood1]CAF3760845.1 unnamed protein product [Rotaria sp. Silwood1]CAF4638888.1 unnamed protein product [Rotaria sp. Silwood1]
MTFNETLYNDDIVFNSFSRIIMAVSFACICILGVIGNLTVLIVALRKQNYKCVTNCYIVNLAITDLLFLLISVPLTTYLGLTNTWILNSFVSCRVHIYLAHVLLQTTCYTLAAMSIDRYLYVTSHHPHPRWRTPLNACLTCILIWAVSIAFVFPYTSLSSSSPPPSPSSDTNKNPLDDCSVSAYHPLFASCFFPFCAYYVLPLVIIALSYTKLFFHMRRSSKNMTRYQGNLLSRACVQIQRRHITRTLFSLTCAFAICWLPIHTLELLNCRQMLDEFYDNHTSLLETIRVIAHALSYFNSCLNPFLYAFFNPEFFM